ncbi:hypothetical protein DPMN_153936 [Dreissena polymorpha]|uniref:Uncharacterized protein n=1 Tax=Dreissena polymorpha TaxID=45954 RepID=A0A9D4FK18_DREPO|nr:hypothetical protein DPMN_153936 [Dreissena polymorpha]
MGEKTRDRGRRISPCRMFDPGGAPGLVIGPCIVEIDGIVIRDVKYQLSNKINVASRVLTRKNALPPGSHVFQPTSIIFELVQDIIGMNLLTKFKEDRTVNVASRVLTRKNALPPGSHVFQPTSIIFELVQDIIGMNLLTKLKEDRTVNVASRVLTRKIAPPPWWPYFSTNRHHF